MSAAKPRRALSQKTRFEVFKRDGFKCMYCGAHPPAVLLHVDHVLAVANGGSNDMDNLVTACQGCNLGKAARDLNVVPQSLQDKADDIAEREAQLRGYSEVLAAKRKRLDDEAWDLMGLYLHPGKDAVPRDQFASVRMFIEKLGYDAVVDAAEIALAAPHVNYRNTFKYFCGICWNKLRKQDGANA